MVFVCSAGCCLFCVLCYDYIAVGHFYWFWRFSMCEGCSRSKGMLRGGVLRVRYCWGLCVYLYILILCFA